MRRRMLLGFISLLAMWTIGATDVPITSNPIPEPIVKRGLAVEVRDLVRLPDTRGLRPAEKDVAPAAWARVSYVRERFARISVSDRREQPAPRICRRGRGLPLHGL
jgi:hypothetical protein